MMSKEKNEEYSMIILSDEAEKKLTRNFIENNTSTRYEKLIEGYLLSNGFRDSNLPYYVNRHMFKKENKKLYVFEKDYDNEFIDSTIRIYVILHKGIYKTSIYTVILSSEIDKYITKNLSIIDRIYYILTDWHIVHRPDEYYTFTGIGIIKYELVLGDIESANTAIKEMQNSLERIIDFYINIVGNIIKKFDKI